MLLVVVAALAVPSLLSEVSTRVESFPSKTFVSLQTGKSNPSCLLNGIVWSKRHPRRRRRPGSEFDVGFNFSDLDLGLSFGGKKSPSKELHSSGNLGFGLPQLSRNFFKGKNSLSMLRLINGTA